MNSSPDNRRRLLRAQIACLALLIACCGAVLIDESTWAAVGLVASAVGLAALDVKSSIVGLLKPHNQEHPQGTVAPTHEDRPLPANEPMSATTSVDQALVTDALASEPTSASAEKSADAFAGTQPAQEIQAAVTSQSITHNEPASVVQSSAPENDAPSMLDFPQLSDTLVQTKEPIAALKHFVRRIRSRERRSEEATPCNLELYAARVLEEAGLFSTDVELPSITVVRPQASHMVYLRCNDPSIPYLALLRVIRIEAALNALRFASASLPPDATMEAAYRLNQGLARSIVAQAPPMDQPLDQQDMGPWPDGEWTVRYGISHAIESVQLPYRLVARYRTNVADGNVAIEFDFTPAEAFPTSCYVDELGIVPTTGDMRQHAAADYALRVALLLAASAFRCSERVRHVWVAAVQSTATRRSCYLSVDFDRWRFGRIDLTNIGNLAEVYRSFAAVLRYEDGWLRPVQQGFSLDEERFCPSRRYLPVSLSSRRLKGHVAESLGCDHVSGLAIEEADGRALVASAIMMHMSSADEANATQKSVRTVLELAGDDPDPTVRSAAERVVRALVEGSLEPEALAVGEEFVRGDALTRANDRAKALLLKQQPLEAHAVLEPILTRIDAAGIYADSATLAYRYFGSYAERALYNRLDGSLENKTVLLVPDAYYEAHLIASIGCLASGRSEKALEHAQHLVELAPLDAHARLHLVKCLEVLNRDDEAIEQLVELLERAFEPQGLGLAYYRMAFFQWKCGNLSAAQACYQNAMRFLPGVLPMLAMELSVLYLQNPDMAQDGLSEDEISDALEAQGIPLAPTQQVSDAFYDCTRASLDAEVFPVARNFARILAAFSGDDVIAGVARSLEDEPDH